MFSFSQLKWKTLFPVFCFGAFVVFFNLKKRVVRINILPFAFNLLISHHLCHLNTRKIVPKVKKKGNNVENLTNYRKWRKTQRKKKKLRKKRTGVKKIPLCSVKQNENQVYYWFKTWTTKTISFNVENRVPALKENVQH